MTLTGEKAVPAGIERAILRGWMACWSLALDVGLTRVGWHRSRRVGGDRGMDLGADNAMLSAIRARIKTRARASCGGHGVRFFRPSDMARVMEEAERATV